jgi:hypothetical protein
MRFRVINFREDNSNVLCKRDSAAQQAYFFSRMGIKYLLPEYAKRGTIDEKIQFRKERI